MNWRLPLGPLLALAIRGPRTQPGDLGQRELAELVGVTRRTVNRWAAEGVPLCSADKAAARLGYHPAEVWGRMFYWAAAA